MTDFTQIETFNSYIFLRNILGCTNKRKDDALLIGIRYTGDKIFALNENSTKAILLLEKSKRLPVWYVSTPYIELTPIATHIKKAIESSKNPFLSEPAFDALKEVIKYNYSS